MHFRAEQRLTVEEFFDLYGGREDRYELVDGVPEMMAGGTRRHARVSRNLLVALATKLSGGPCEPFGADMAVRTGDRTVRLPDVTISCDPADLQGDDDATEEVRFLSSPRVLIEVLSPSTTKSDRTGKLLEYQSLASVDSIVLIDPRRRSFSLYERVSELRWLNTLHLPGADLTLRDPAVTLTADEIFEGV
jgi:Uma2 family endonuclease